jgi:hydrogenase maturation protease
MIDEAPPEPQPGAIVIVGVGRERYMDDSVGLAVARRLLSEGLPDAVTVEESRTCGMELVPALDGAAWAIIIAALDLGEEPGTVRVFGGSDLEDGTVLIADKPGRPALVDVLELAAMADLAPEVTIVAVQPGEIAPGYEMTAPVQAAAEEATQEVRRLLAD